MRLTRRKRTLAGYGGKVLSSVADLTAALFDRRTPLAAKLVVGAVLAYAVSPVDIIPDFMPVLGQLDDVLLLSIGFWVARRMIPPQVLEDARSARNTRELPAE